MSTYRPDSELSRFNAGSAASWTEVSSETLRVVEAALGTSRLVEGAFDPTIGPLVELWGFGPGGRAPNVPTEDRIQDLLRNINYGHLRTRAAPAALGKAREGLRVDLSGIAKGFAVDKLAEHLERIGIEYYLVEIGGELRGRGYSPRGHLASRNREAFPGIRDGATGRAPRRAGPGHLR